MEGPIIIARNAVCVGVTATVKGSLSFEWMRACFHFILGLKSSNIVPSSLVSIFLRLVLYSRVFHV